MKPFFFTSVSFLAALLFAAPVSAQWKFSVGSGARHVRMTEYEINGQQLVREDGWLPGLALNAVFHQRGWHYGVSGEVYRSNLNYEGRLQNGAPFATDTATTQSRVTAELARELNENVRAIGALEYDQWQRNVLGRGSIAGVNERYASGRLLVGAATTAQPFSAVNVEFKGLLVLAHPERLRVRFDNQLYDNAHLSTKPAIGLRLALTARPFTLPNLSFAADFEWMQIKRSDDAILRRNGTPVGTVAQPEHRRSAIGFRANYRF
jgi:hypothetical protein